MKNKIEFYFIAATDTHADKSFFNATETENVFFSDVELIGSHLFFKNFKNVCRHLILFLLTKR